MPGWCGSTARRDERPPRWSPTTPRWIVIAVTRPFVSRAGTKLAAALDRFGIDPPGVCLDAGASTGGFTDVCSPRRGARRRGRRRLRPARVVAPHRPPRDGARADERPRPRRRRRALPRRSSSSPTSRSSRCAQRPARARRARRSGSDVRRPGEAPVRAGRDEVGARRGRARPGDLARVLDAVVEVGDGARGRRRGADGVADPGPGGQRRVLPRAVAWATRPDRSTSTPRSARRGGRGGALMTASGS